MVRNCEYFNETFLHILFTGFKRYHQRLNFRIKLCEIQSQKIKYCAAHIVMYLPVHINFFTKNANSKSYYKNAYISWWKIKTKYKNYFETFMLADLFEVKQFPKRWQLKRHLTLDAHKPARCQQWRRTQALDPGPHNTNVSQYNNTHSHVHS